MENVSFYFMVPVLAGFINENRAVYSGGEYYPFDFVGIGTYDFVEQSESEYI